MTRSAIAQEIIDLIISLLHSDDADNDALRASLNCALASRCCLARARINVFQSITIPWEDDPSTTQVFELLEHPLCSVPVMDVKLVAFKGPSSVGESRVHSELHAILDRFPYASSLDYTSFPDAEPLADAISATFFRQITNLSLFGMVYWNSVDLVNKLVARCSPLQRLSIYSSQKHISSPRWPFHTSPSTEATLTWPHSLQVVGAHTYNYFEEKFQWLIAQGCTNVHSLDITGTRLDADITSYLVILGPNLRHVRCSWPDPSQGCLSNNSNIETMELHGGFRYFVSDDYETDTFHGSDVLLEDTLTSFPTSKLKRLAVHYTAFIDPYLQPTPVENDLWEKLDQRLAEGQFMPCLEELHFAGEDQTSSDRHYVLDLDLQMRVKKLFREKFPRCNAKGMMTFSFHAIELDL